MKDSWLKRKLVALYEWFYEARRLFVLRTMYRPRIMSPEQTLNYIEKNKCSIARYGDGEFDCILNVRDIGFQQRSKELAVELSRVLDNKDKRLLLCIPRCINTVKGCKQFAKTFWIYWGQADEHHKKIVDLIWGHTGKHYLFGDAQITRPYIDWVDDKRAKRTFPLLKRLWGGVNILIVEGKETRLGVGNDLFSNAKSIKRILCPAINAFESRDKIKDAVIRNYHGELIIMALGPTATVLAADFAMMNMQTLDIGNIDIEYEWFLRGAKEKVAIPGKFTNEAKDGREDIAACKDEAYLSQIIEQIDC